MGSVTLLKVRLRVRARVPLASTRRYPLALDTEIPTSLDTEIDTEFRTEIRRRCGTILQRKSGLLSSAAARCPSSDPNAPRAKTSWSETVFRQLRKGCLPQPIFDGQMRGPTPPRAAPAGAPRMAAPTRGGLPRRDACSTPRRRAVGVPVGSRARRVWTFMTPLLAQRPVGGGAVVASPFLPLDARRGTPSR